MEKHQTVNVEMVNSQKKKNVMIVMLIAKLVKMTQEIVNHAQEIEKMNQLVHVLMELTTQVKKNAHHVMTIVMDVIHLLTTVFSVPMDMLPHQNVH